MDTALYCIQCFSMGIYNEATFNRSALKIENIKNINQKLQN